MKSPLYILHLEDNPNDAKLIRAALEIDGIACATTCVKTQTEFVAALESGGFDLVLSDFSLSGFDGLSAAEIVHTHWPALPFIFVSGTMVEERAGAALEGRVMDYVPKYDLLLLASAVRCAMEKSDGDHGELPCISRHHDLAMFCLPPDGRWQTESQLIGQSRLGNRVRRIYRNLAATGYCELKIVPILDHLGETEDFMRMYRATPKMHQAYKKRPDKEKPVSMYLLSEPINPIKSMPETINKTRKHKAIGGVFSNRENVDQAVLAFRALGIAEKDIHIVVSLYDKTREGKILVTVHNVKEPAAVIEIFDDNHADYNPNGSRNVRHDVAGLTVGVALGATAGGATGTVVGGPAGTIIGAATGAVVGGGAGAAVGKVKEHLK